MVEGLRLGSIVYFSKGNWVEGLGLRLWVQHHGIIRVHSSKRFLRVRVQGLGLHIC